MAWLRSALSKAADRAAEVGSKNNLTRAVRSYAGAVYHQAAGGAKIFQDRLSGRNLNSFKDAVKRLNEVSLNARGAERLQSLGRWLGALKDIAESNPASPRSPESGDSSLSPRKALTTLFYDFENGGGPMNFRDVFLESRALEHIVTALILEAPKDEEIGILSEMFGLCLAGGQELHNAFISSVQDLAKAFLTLSEEITIGRSELLELAQNAVTGLKLSPESERLDAEILYLQETMAKKQGIVMSKDNLTSNEDPSITEEVLEFGARIRHCLRRKEELLLAGDTAESRTEKVNKIKEATVGLASSIKEIEQKVIENRQQKDKATKYRDSKALEVQETEKALASEIRALQKKKEELETQLNEVNAALSVATARHINTQEEKEQFDEASSNIVAHLFIQEGELSRSIAARKSEAVVASTWIGFLEDTWLLQTSCLEEKTKEFKREVQEAKQQYLSIALTNLSYYQEETTLLLKHLKYFNDEIDAGKNSSSVEVQKEISGKIVQEKYLDTEKQVHRFLEILERLSNEVKAFGLEEDGDDVEKKLLKCLETISSLKSEFEERKRPELDLGDDSKQQTKTDTVNTDLPKEKLNENTADGWDGWEVEA